MFRRCRHSCSGCRCRRHAVVVVVVVVFLTVVVSRRSRRYNDSNSIARMLFTGILYLQVFSPFVFSSLAAVPHTVLHWVTLSFELNRVINFSLIMYLYFYFWSRVSGVTTLRRPCGIEYCGCDCVCFTLILMSCSFVCNYMSTNFKKKSKLNAQSKP